LGLDNAAEQNSTDWLTMTRSLPIFNPMAEYYPPHLDRVFHALSDATRRAMLARLVDGERSVGELAAPFEMSLAAASKHIKTLEGAGLVKREVRGRTHICTLEPAALADADAWLQRYAAFWDARLDALAALLNAEDDQPSIPLEVPSP
jgi:DNA-binding transcriptional ArsR family regulator